MGLSFYDVSVGSYTQVVEAAAGWLEKAREHFDAAGQSADAVVGERLYEDMADFHFQVVCITHHSLEALRGMEAGEFSPPDYPQTDYAGLEQMTQATLGALRDMSPDAINGLADRRLVFKLGGNEIPFTAENFLLSFSLPNFYFHTTTAYDILRARGVPLGKRDFLGALKMG